MTKKEKLTGLEATFITLRDRKGQPDPVPTIPTGWAGLPPLPGGKVALVVSEDESRWVFLRRLVEFNQGSGGRILLVGGAGFLAELPTAGTVIPYPFCPEGRHNEVVREGLEKGNRFKAVETDYLEGCLVATQWACHLGYDLVVVSPELYPKRRAHLRSDDPRGWVWSMYLPGLAKFARKGRTVVVFTHPLEFNARVFKFFSCNTFVTELQDGGLGAMNVTVSKSKSAPIQGQVIVHHLDGRLSEEPGQ